jgi:hypothetical protein
LRLNLIYRRSWLASEGGLRLNLIYRRSWLASEGGLTADPSLADVLDLL